MARAAATDEAIHLALETPTLGIGCHLILVDGDPVLSSQEISRLANPNIGRLQPSLGSFLSRLYSRPFIRKQLLQEIEVEALAQIALLQSRGLRLTHIDTHKHTHMFPAVLRPVLRAARRAGITAVRNPYEPAWSVRATPNAPWLRKAQVQLLRTMETTFHRIVREEGFTTTQGAIGVLATGTLDASTVTSLLAAMPDGLWELVTHPGYNDPALAQVKTRLRASREIEMNALQNLNRAANLQLIHYGQLPALKP
jgi:predicted glycoside hydrolase/deacetylase ChbG (UPF0249 family)